MPKTCVAFNCHSRQSKACNLTFHLFPFSKPDLLSKWTIAVKRKNWKPQKNSYLCSLHFEDSCYKSNWIFPQSGKTYDERKTLVPRKIKKLKQDAVPTLFDFGATAIPKKTRRLLNRQPNHSSPSASPSASEKSSTDDETDSAPETVQINFEMRTKDVQVNRKHFVDGKPTPSNPNPLIAGSPATTEVQRGASNRKSNVSGRRHRKQLALSDSPVLSLSTDVCAESDILKIDCMSSVKEKQVESISSTDVFDESDFFKIECISSVKEEQAESISSTDVFAESDFFKIQCVSSVKEEQAESVSFCNTATSPRSPANMLCSTASQCSPQHSAKYTYNLQLYSDLKQKVWSRDRYIVALKTKVRCLLKERRRLDMLLKIEDRNRTFNCRKRRKLTQKQVGLCERTLLEAENVGLENSQCTQLTETAVDEHEQQDTDSVTCSISDDRFRFNSTDFSEESSHQSVTYPSMQLPLIIESDSLPVT